MDHKNLEALLGIRIEFLRKFGVMKNERKNTPFKETFKGVLWPLRRLLQAFIK